VRALKMMTTILAGACLAAGGARADEASERSRPVPVDLDATSIKDTYCKDVAAMMETHVASLNRFDPKRHKIRLACGPDSVEAVWLVTKVGKSKAELVGARSTLVRTTVKTANPGSIGLLVMQDLLKKLPWDGEVRSIHGPKTAWEKIRQNNLGKVPVTLSKLKPAPHRKRVRLSLGAVNSDTIGVCLPIEIGFLTPTDGSATFTPLGSAIVTDVDVFNSYGEAWSKTNWKGMRDKELFFRHKNAGEDTFAKRGNKQCEKLTGFAGSRTLDNLLSGNMDALFSSETIELNGVNQGVGLAYYQLRANNGLGVKGGIAGWIYNTVLIGDLFMGNFNIVRHVIAPGYSPKLGGQEINSEINMGEIYANIILDTEEWAIFAGPGAFFAKINLPYDSPEKNVVSTTEVTTPEGRFQKTETKYPQRDVIVNPAFNFGGQYLFDPYRFDIRFAASFLKKNGEHLSIYTNADYMLTQTWYTGLNLYVVRFGDAADGSPGANYFSFGARVGFDLQRTRGKR